MESEPELDWPTDCSGCECGGGCYDYQSCGVNIDFCHICEFSIISAVKHRVIIKNAVDTRHRNIPICLDCRSHLIKNGTFKLLKPFRFEDVTTKLFGWKQDETGTWRTDYSRTIDHVHSERLPAEVLVTKPIKIYVSHQVDLEFTADE